MIARKRGFCVLCNALWGAGDEIQQKGRLFAHKPCMQAYKETLSQYKKELT